MKLPTFPGFVALATACLFAAPVQSQAHDNHKVSVYVDHDHDGHYNRKTFEVHGDHHYYGDHRYYGARYYGGHYYAPGYYSYRYPYGSYYGPTVSFYAGPRYYSSYGYDRHDDTALDVQGALRRRGYYHGAIDGDIGPGSREAIRAYQYDRRLPVTGRIDDRLLDSLGL